MQETTPNPLKLRPLSERLCPSCRWAGPQNRTRSWGGHASFSGPTPQAVTHAPHGFSVLCILSCVCCGWAGPQTMAWDGHAPCVQAPPPVLSLTSCPCCSSMLLGGHAPFPSSPLTPPPTQEGWGTLTQACHS